MKGNIRLINLIVLAFIGITICLIGIEFGTKFGDQGLSVILGNKIFYWGLAFLFAFLISLKSKIVYLMITFIALLVSIIFVYRGIIHTFFSISGSISGSSLMYLIIFAIFGFIQIKAIIVEIKLIDFKRNRSKKFKDGEIK